MLPSMQPLPKAFVLVVAAGNSYGDACGYSPASAYIIPSDFPDFRNHVTYKSKRPILYLGNIFAPGSSIKVGWTGSNTVTRTISGGTSMASPHVACVAALIIDQTPGISPVDVVATMKRSKRSDFGYSRTPNLLVYTGDISGETIIRVSYLHIDRHHASQCTDNPHVNQFTIRVAYQSVRRLPRHRLRDVLRCAANTDIVNACSDCCSKT
jgi:hypothetical protein